MDMRIRSTTIGVAAAAALGLAQAASAAEMPDTIYPFPQNASSTWVHNTLMQKGFTHVGPVDHSGNIYSTTAMWDGRLVQLRIDQQNGGITNESAGDTAISTVGVMNKAHVRSELQRLGYSDIGTIKHSGNIFSTQAMYRGHVVTLSVNERDGGVTRHSVMAEGAPVVRSGQLKPASGIQTSGELAIPVPRKKMDKAYLEKQLATLGFTDVRNLEKRGKFHYVEAKKNGQWVQLRINGLQGAVKVVGG